MQTCHKEARCISSASSHFSKKPQYMFISKLNKRGRGNRGKGREEKKSDEMR
jgi:hypothetical protein